MYMAVYAIRDDIPIEECKKVVSDIVRICGMSTNGIRAEYWKFPILDNPSESCYTYVQPILTSLIACDQWPEIPGAYFFVISCTKFKDHLLYAHLRKRFKDISYYTCEARMPNQMKGGDTHGKQKETEEGREETPEGEGQ